MNAVDETLLKFVKLVEEAMKDGYGEVLLKIVVQSGKVTIVNLSKTQSIKVPE